MSTNAKISERVIALRARLGLNQAEFANKLGISRNYVSMIEGGREPAKHLLMAIEAMERNLSSGSVSELMLKEDPAESSIGSASKFTEARKILGWPQDKMAQELGIDRSYLSQLENGHRVPSLRLQKTLQSLLDPAPRPVEVIPDPIPDDEISEGIRALSGLCSSYLAASKDARRVVLTQIHLTAAGLRSLTRP